MRNYYCLGGRFYIKYMYVDVNRDYDYIADALFYKREIPVHFKDEMIRNGDKYRLIFCRVKRKYQQKFEEALEELKTKMNLLGYTDYEEYCDKLQRELNEVNKNA